MQKKILVILLILVLLSVFYSAKPDVDKRKNIKVQEEPKGENETGCGYFLNGTWHEYECCNDTECEEGMVCIDHECVEVECAGDVNLNLELNEGRIRAKVTGIKNCDEKTVTIRSGSCTGKVLCSFIWDVSECYFMIPQPGSYEYFACVDMNGDGKYSSDEMDAEKIVVMLYEPADKNQTYAWKQEVKNEESPWEVCVPLGLFVLVLAFLLFPWVQETLESRKKRSRSRKRKI